MKDFIIIDAWVIGLHAVALAILDINPLLNILIGGFDWHVNFNGYAYRFVMLFFAIAHSDSPDNR